jgi:hypothetical protein
MSALLAKVICQRLLGDLDQMLRAFRAAAPQDPALRGPVVRVGADARVRQQPLKRGGGWVSPSVPAAGRNVIKAVRDSSEIPNRHCADDASTP